LIPAHEVLFLGSLILFDLLTNQKWTSDEQEKKE
ncbi:hypothetical protein E2320_006981, partial [Naja naja]